MKVAEQSLSKKSGKEAQKGASSPAEKLESETSSKGVRKEIIKKFPVRCNLEDYAPPTIPLHGIRPVAKSPTSMMVRSTPPIMPSTDISLPVAKTK
ncbi:MAG: hypothetical protein IPL73_13875 [Candidatus Obscuribacter sp.]|nr:hypothetical protein [Candidatus Obscuribacter sp.]